MQESVIPITARRDDSWTVDVQKRAEGWQDRDDDRMLARKYLNNDSHVEQAQEVSFRAFFVNRLCSVGVEEGARRGVSLGLGVVHKVTLGATGVFRRSGLNRSFLFVHTRGLSTG